MNSLNRLFCFSIGFTCMLIISRLIRTGNHAYVFLLWNLFLAWLPLVFSGLLNKLRPALHNWMIFGLWLLFFPNALYLVTDLVHLRNRYDAPEWFDIILLFSAAINGLMLAYASLIKVEAFLTSMFKSRKTEMILAGCFFIGSFGVYLGRFLRLNSWNLFTHPLSLSRQVYVQFSEPFEHLQTWGMTGTLAVFFTLFYFTIKKLPDVLKS